MAEIKMPPKSESTDAKKHEIKKIGGGKLRKNPGRKIADLFLDEDVSSVKGYILFDVVIPAIKNTIVDIVTNGIEMLFWGDSRGSRRASGRRDRTSYESYYASGRSSSRARRRDDDDDTEHRQSKMDYRDVIFESRGEAEEVLQALMEACAVYHQVTVADLFDAAGVTGNGFTDQKWGWTNLDGCSTRRVRDGYVIDLPRLEDLR